MKETKFSASACRFCRSYKPEGRRGGLCQRLGVPVEGSWKACAFASPPFETTLEKLEDIFQHSVSLDLSPETKITTQMSELESDQTKGQDTVISIQDQVA